MTSNWGEGVPDSAIIMLAQAMLSRVKLHGMKVDTRKAAIAIIKGMRPAVSKAIPLTAVIHSAIGKVALPPSLCSACGKALPYGSLCRTIWTTYDGEHIQCTGGFKK